MSQSFEVRQHTGAAQRGTGRYWTDKQLAAALRSIAVDGRVTVKMCRDRYEARIGTARPFPSPAAYLIRWGSWNAGVEACGLTHGNARRQYERISVERLVADVALVMAALGKPPTVAEYERYSREHPEQQLASCSYIRRRFGSWLEAVNDAMALPVAP